MSVKTKEQLRDYADANINTNGVQGLSAATLNTMWNDAVDSLASESGSIVYVPYTGATSDTDLGSYDLEATDLLSNNDIVVGSTSAKGIRVNPDSSSWGWGELKGLQTPDDNPTTRPTLSAFRGGNVRKNAYAAGEKMDVEFHVPHDYKKGTDMYIHFHWCHNGTAISGNIVGTVYHTAAKGYDQQIYPAEKTITLTYATVDIATTPRWQHMITEVQLSQTGGSTTLMDTDDIEPDMVISVNFTMTTIPTITDGSPNEPFVDYIDLHYQTTNIGTISRSPDFYAVAP